MPRRSVLIFSVSLALLVLLAMTYLLGFAVSKKRFVGHRTSLRVFEAIGRPLESLVHKAVPPSGRFNKRLSTLTPGENLSESQRQKIEELRALGYLSGSTEATEQSGVTVINHEKSYPGFNLQTDGHAPMATLFDSEGAQLHSWTYPFEKAFPGSDAPPWSEGTKYWRRVALLSDGALLAIYEGNGLIKLDKESQLVWAYPGWAHHDLEVQEDGTIFTLTREAGMVPNINKDMPILHDFIVALDENGQETYKLSLLEAIENSNYATALTLMLRETDDGDVLHTNTIEILDGSIAEAVPAFRKGNALISIRNQSLLAVVDLEARAIVWVLSGFFVQQHQPTILDNGHMLLFDNLGDDGFSRILEIDPATQDIRWSYDGHRTGFRSKTCGSNQRLPNGNTLITETDNGRALEVSASGELVWEYYTPHRTGDQEEYIASLFEVLRIPVEDVSNWLHE